MTLKINNLRFRRATGLAAFGARTLTIVIFTSLIISGCGSDEDAPPPNDAAPADSPQMKLSQPSPAVPGPGNLNPHPPDPALVDDWKTFTYRTVKIYYEEGHPMESTFYTMANVIMYGQRQLAQFLAFPEALDTATIYYYTGPGQALEMIGTYHPFATDSTIQFAPPSPYGAPLAMYVLNKWQQHPPEFKFLREGVIALFDLSGKDYFKLTQRLFDDTTTELSLVSLAADTTIDVNLERERSGPAATFVNFVYYTGGPAAFRELYHHQGRFDEAIKDALGMNLPQAELGWRQYVRNPPQPDTTLETNGQ